MVILQFVTTPAALSVGTRFPGNVSGREARMRVAARPPSHLSLFSSSSSSREYNKFISNPPQFPWSPNVVSILFRNNTFSPPKPLTFKTCCFHKHNEEHEFFKDFSVLSSDVTWDSGRIWSTMALYIFSLHIPLSFGGLSIVAQLLHQTVLDPKTVEKEVPEGRNWIQGSALGFGSLMLLVFLTSLIADKMIGPKANPSIYGGMLDE